MPFDKSSSPDGKVGRSLAVDMSKILFVLSLFCHSTFAYSVFNTNCTLPEHIVNYVSSPDTRGTIDIAWSCFATIIACVYTVLHLNLPRRPEHVSPKRKATLSWENDIFTPGLMVFIGTFCPEWIFTVALMEFWDASHQLKELRNSERLREAGSKVRKSWKLSHMFFANMGGQYFDKCSLKIVLINDRDRQASY